MAYQRILVPIDFSPLSRQALRHGIAFAQKFEARLSLLHVVELAGTATAQEMAHVVKEHHDQTRRMLAAIVAPELRDQLDLHVIVKAGDVVNEILASVEEEQSDLAVIGTHGRGVLSRWLIGSVARSVLRKARIPVLSVCHVATEPAFRNILFASAHPGALAEGPLLALRFAHDAGAKLTTFHSVEVGVEGGAVYLADQRIEEARHAMERLTVEAARMKVDLEIALADGPAPTMILQTAVQRSADLIILSIPKTDDSENQIGAVASHVIRQAHVPVLTIPVRMSASEAKIPQPKVA